MQLNYPPAIIHLSLWVFILESQQVYLWGIVSKMVLSLLEGGRWSETLVMLVDRETLVLLIYVRVISKGMY